MLSILYSDFEQFGCPNCGCDSAKGNHALGGIITKEIIKQYKNG